MESLNQKLDEYERWFRTLDRQLRALELERRKLSAVVNHTDAGFIVLDPSMRVVWANAVFRRHYGAISPHQPTSLIGRRCNEALCGDSTICRGCPARAPFETAAVAHHEINLRVQGRVRHLYVTAMPVQTPEGRVEQCMVMLQDVSDLEVLRQREEQLRQSQKMEAVGRLAGGIAHDFNNLLTAITGYSRLLLTRLPMDNPLRREAREIAQAADQAAALTGQLLAFSRRQVLAPKVLALNSVVQEMHSMLQRLIGENIDLAMSTVPELWNVRADPGQVQQVLLNLIVNARDAMPRGGKITIQTANVELSEAYAREHASVVAGDYAMLSVTDTGCGISPELQGKIFEPFFTTKDLGQGTGLGLSTVYGIVKQSGGNVWVYSEPGVGTTFKVYLPRARAAADPRSDRRSAAPSVARGTETVLLVEDDDSVRSLACEVLEEAGYRVLVACDGPTALEVIETSEDSVELLVTDLIMPRMGGAELSKLLQPERPEMKVLFISGYTDSAVFHQGLLEPGSHFMQKPFTPASLAEKVRQILDLPLVATIATRSR